jgi:3-phenylpropionate/trans-cinnamate dioxygenase ferredoxin reductase subunit
MRKHAVAIGAGQAAVAFAAKLHATDPAWSITIVGEEPVLPYQRPPLSKKYMTGEMTLDRLLLRPRDWYDEQGIACRTGLRVEDIDPKNARMRISDGSTVAYDAALISTGAIPRRLPAAIGGDLAGVFTLRSLADADHLAEEFKPDRSLLVVGGGYIGLEAAAVAALAGMKVRVVEMAPRILQRVAAPETAERVRSEHLAHRVEILEGVSLIRLTGKDGRVAGADFANGDSIECDCVLVGIGIVPATGLAEAAGLTVDNGIAVDARCQTSASGIFAAGDCACFPFQGRHIRLESVQNAIDQAEAAALAVAGRDVEYRPVPWFWSDQYDMKLQIAGLNFGYDRTVIRAGQRDGASSVWYFANGAFRAVDAINDSRAYMVGKRLLETGRSIAPDQAADAALDLKSLI